MPASMPAATAIAPDGPGADLYEAAHVHGVYDAIAPHFAATRYAPWPRVDSFLADIPAGSLVLDVGCGNGKYLGVCGKDVFVVGVDRCQGLVGFAGKGGSDVGVADVRALPFRDGFFDAAVCIAVLHHLVTVERRVEALVEMLRVLKPGGRALVYVWALERPSVPEPRKGNHGRKMLSRRFETQDVFVPWHMRRRKAGAESDKILGDTEEIHKRFYHVYHERELEAEVAQVRGTRIVEAFYDHQNWCAVIERVEATTDS